MAEGFIRSCVSREVLESGPGDAARLNCICGPLSAARSGKLGSGIGPSPLCNQKKILHHINTQQLG